ncbi:hypothetical protein CEXT_429221 [Caerostris extrusa]|uniref:Ribosomal protein L16 n=1 Tax=Caerostris extrusa TaxID=172846 RepID=A0AAV4MVI8_CAEEX|nr:hypothetical protein CEXT_429221 [Caerostris extrusa]
MCCTYPKIVTSLKCCRTIAVVNIVGSGATRSLICRGARRGRQKGSPTVYMYSNSSRVWPERVMGVKFTCKKRRQFSRRNLRFGATAAQTGLVMKSTYLEACFNTKAALEAALSGTLLKCKLSSMCVIIRQPITNECEYLWLERIEDISTCLP